MSEKPLTMHPFESAIVRTLEADNARLTAEVERLRAALEDCIELLDDLGWTPEAERALAALTQETSDEHS